MSTNQSKGKVIAIIAMMFLFAMISFVTNLAAPFGNIWGNTYSWAGMMGNMMNFLAYLVMGIPAGKLIVKIGYKRTALMAMAVGAAGLFVQYLSSVFGADTTVWASLSLKLNFVVYLLGAFICGICVCMLNTVVNPMLNLLGGGGNKGNQYIQIGGTLNSLSGTVTPLFVGMLIGQVTANTSMVDVVPLLFIAMGVFIASFIVIYFVDIIEPASSNSDTKFESSPWHFRHFVLGAIAIFFYVGIEIGIPGEMNFYLSKPGGVLGDAAVAGSIAAIYWLLMMVGRFSSSLISGKISTRAQMITASTVAILLTLVAIFLPEDVKITLKGQEVPMKCLFIILCGICTSVMWGGIFNLATEGLGKYTAQASGIFMMLVVGGGVMPLIQDAIGTSVDYITSYWLIIAMLGYLLYYALIGCKNVNKDIPV